MFLILAIMLEIVRWLRKYSLALSSRFNHFNNEPVIDNSKYFDSCCIYNILADYVNDKKKINHQIVSLVPQIFKHKINRI
jgi:hypothetical protein